MEQQMLVPKRSARCRVPSCSAWNGSRLKTPSPTNISPAAPQRSASSGAMKLSCSSRRQYMVSVRRDSTRFALSALCWKSKATFEYICGHSGVSP
ncbi:hypothetical protein DQ04_08481040 [Trypanosoma grayi]|uniref:hypothetical protein n=1 Tax=Trypanosoma grayi TaxID=71804 RepID=UPI0004F44FBB|nr:hypothetical protein DQ04_08481040 [Trypanosoma grayi]KEG07918.1 hypothetical protein DQ04_08481040 [Trypanosoma grayi]